MMPALLTDLYELNMAASYLRRGMTGPATFSLFVRELPPGRGFYVAAGVDDCLDALESFAFTDADADWLASHGFPKDMVEALAGIRFTGDVYSVGEGEVLLANEPVLEVTAPLPEAQIVEALLLNLVTFQCAIATKAVRCRDAAGPIDLVDFALRRTHGPDAGLAVARVCALAGFVGTSNVEAARRFGLRPVGTMAHSYVEVFADEDAAFSAFVEDLPGPYTFLVDTYDTLAGVRVAARLIGRLRAGGRDAPQMAIRIDSGDLASLSHEARALLDAAGLHDVGIFVSGALDEYGLQALREAQAPVDAAGVGTRMGVSADAPYLDSVYKLVEVAGRPVTKLSTGKESLPGAKQVWRRATCPDVLATRGEPGPRRARPLLERTMRAGRRVASRDDLRTARARVEAGLAWIPEGARRITNPTAPRPEVSAALGALDRETTTRLRNAVSEKKMAPRAADELTGRDT